MFDGHGGVDAAIYAANHLHVNLVRQESFSQDPADALCRAFKLTDERFVKKASREVTTSANVMNHIFNTSVDDATTTTTCTTISIYLLIYSQIMVSIG